VIEERAITGRKDLGRIGVVHRVPVRAVDLLKREQVRLRWLGVHARGTAGSVKRPLQELMHVGLLLSLSLPLCAPVRRQPSAPRATRPGYSLLRRSRQKQTAADRVRGSV